MQTKILKQEDLEAERNKLLPKFDKLRVAEEKQKERVKQAEKKLREVSERTWQVSERIAGLNGLISQCEDGKVEVI